MTEKEPDLEAAYALETPADNRRLYADWATTYDSNFVSKMDYRLPQLVALVLAEVLDGRTPVLDVGAGTGQVAEHFPLRATTPIDALDLSPDMLRVAAAKGLYRSTIEGDLTQHLTIADETYGAIASAGTFTHGHVGPDALDELLRVAQPDAVFVLSINAEHFEGHGFAAKIDALAPLITEPEKRTVGIYGPKADPARHADQAHILVFRKR